MSFLQKYRFHLIGVLVIVGAILLAVQLFHKSAPANTSYTSSEFSFSYPRTYDTEEYAPGVVTVGHRVKGGFAPVVEVNTYESDPQSALPKTFAIFVKQQIEALCGSDDSQTSITCTQTDVAPYTSALGEKGETMNLKAVSKNLKTGTTTSATYGPFYVFSTTPTNPNTKDKAFHYSGVFIYPSFIAFLGGNTSPELLHQVIDTFAFPKQK